MKPIMMITFLVAILLGFCLGGLANDLTTLSAGSTVADHASSVAGYLKTVVSVVYATTVLTVDPCAATSSVTSVAGKVELRSPQVFAKKPLSTTTTTRYSTLRRTVTVPRFDTIYIPQSRHSFKTRTTPNTTQTSTGYTTDSAPATATAHGLHPLPTAASGSDDVENYNHEFDDEYDFEGEYDSEGEYDFDEDENVEATKLELRDLPGASVAATTTTCPSDISGEYQFPHLIVSTSVGMPDESVGDQYAAWISPAVTTLFNFDVPATYAGTCALIFLFPFMSQLDPSAGTYTYSGMEQVEYQDGGLSFALLGGVADSSTTYNTSPAVAVDYGKIKILPGNQYTVSTFPCPAGKTITIQGRSVNNTELDYFQSAASKPIGLFLVPCV